MVAALGSSTRVSSVDGVSQESCPSGDIFFDMDCCLGWQIDYSYTITDDCGNSTDFAYTDLGTGEFDNLDNVTVSGGDHTPIDITGGEQPEGSDPHHRSPAEPDQRLQHAGLRGEQQHAPAHRPVNERTVRPGTVRRQCERGRPVRARHRRQQPVRGMYQVRLSSSDYVVVKKLLVSE